VSQDPQEEAINPMNIQDSDQNEDEKQKEEKE